MQVRAVIVVDSAPPTGGHGRFGPSAAAFEPVANRPIVQHVLDGLVEARVDHVIVTGAVEALIDVRACMRGYESRFASVDFAPCRDSQDLAGTLSAVEPRVGDAPCLLQPADGLFDGPLLALVDLLEQGTPDLLLFAAPDIEYTLGNREGAERGRAEAIPYDGRRTYDGRRIEDIGVFAAGAFRRASEAVRGIGAIDLADAGKRLAAVGASVDVHRVDGWRRYRGDGRDLLELNRVALDRLATDVPLSVGRLNRWEGRVHIDPTASVRDSTMIGPCVIGAGATVNEAHIGPYTSIGAGARIEGTEIERSIVAPGASVMHVGGRLVSSLVGRDARVFRDFSLPRGLRLWVGDGDEVALC